MKNIFIIFILTLSIFSCQKINKIEKVSIASIKAPLEGEINKDVEFELSFYVNNGCGQFNRFIESRIGNTITIEIEAKYVGNGCTKNISRRTVSYKFKTFLSGEYTFRIKTEKDKYTAKTVFISE